MNATPPRVATLAVAAVLLAGWPHLTASQLAPAREYEIKAAFLLNFARFIDWPDDAFKTERDGLVIEVVGRDPFDGALDRLVAGKMVDQRPVAILYSTDVSAGPHGHMVFVGASARKQTSSLLSAIKLNRTPVLTVSDIDQFAENGGVIGLVSGASVTFVINRAAANRARLRVSSKLLSLARVLDRDSIGWIPVPPLANSRADHP